MQWKRRKDANHKTIMAAFSDHPACDVLDLYQVGGGCPDLLVAIQGAHGSTNVLVEIKNGDKATYTAAQDAFNARWRGPRETVRDMAGVVNLIAAYGGKR